MGQSINLNRDIPVDGYIQILNYGGFRAKFVVQYTVNGQTVTKDSGAFLIGQTRRINIPKDAIDIYLSVQIDMLIETWIEIYSKYLKNPDQLCFVVYGVTIAAICSQIPCDSPNGSIPPDNNSPCCRCCCCKKFNC